MIQQQKGPVRMYKVSGKLQRNKRRKGDSSELGKLANEPEQCSWFCRTNDLTLEVKPSVSGSEAKKNTFSHHCEPTKFA